MEPRYVDVYIDGIKIPRNENNRTIQLIGNNLINPLHWDSGETLQINVTLDLASGEHYAIVSTQYGVTASKGFDAS